MVPNPAPIEHRMFIYIRGLDPLHGLVDEILIRLREKGITPRVLGSYTDPNKPENWGVIIDVPRSADLNGFYGFLNEERRPYTTLEVDRYCGSNFKSHS